MAAGEKGLRGARRALTYAGMDRLPPDTRIGRARLRVGDLERSLRFYRDGLGLRVRRDEGVEVTLAAGEQADGNGSTSKGRELLVLEERPGIARRPRRPMTTGLYHVALLVPSRRALGRALIGLDQLGYPLRGMSDHAVSESLYLDDPDGNGLEIYADRPRRQWPVQDGVIQMTVDPMDVEGVVAAGRERPESWAGLPTETTVGHVHFTVSRLHPSVTFYRDVVGFDEMMRIPTLAAVSAGGYHHHVNLNIWAGEGAPNDSDRVAGLSGWELEISDENERQALVARVRKAGALAPSSGGSAARDPDGITLDIVAPG
jgi:catechol 2,3-dioxygenase